MAKVRELEAIAADPNRSQRVRTSARRGARQITRDLATSQGLSFTPEELTAEVNPLLARMDGWGTPRLASDPVIQSSNPSKIGVGAGPGAAGIRDEVFASNRQYDDSDKHGSKPYVVGGKQVSVEPTNGQRALDFSFQISQDSPRRIGIDLETNEIVILDRTGNLVGDGQVIGGVYHGHVRSIDELRPEHKNILAKNGIKLNKKGTIVLDPEYWGNSDATEN